jgi:hypothetical protein
MNKAGATSGYGQPFLWGLPATKTRGFTAVHNKGPAYVFQWHYHPEWEIVYIHSGCGTRHVGESVEKSPAKTRPVSPAGP